MMSVTFSAKTLPMRSRPMAEAEAGPSRALLISARLSTTGVIPRDPGPHGMESIEQEGRSKMKNIETLNSVQKSRFPSRRRRTLNNWRAGTFAAALASVVVRFHNSSLPLSETGPDPTQARLAMAKVNNWRKGKGKEMGRTIITWREGLKMPYGEDTAWSTRRSCWPTGNLGPPRPQ